MALHRPPSGDDEPGETGDSSPAGAAAGEDHAGDRFTGRARVASVEGGLVLPGSREERFLPRDKRSPARVAGRARVGVPDPPPPTSPTGRAAAPRPPTGPAVRPRRRPRWGRIAFVALAALVLLAGCGVLIGYQWMRGVDDGLKREDPFASLEGRPPKVVDGAMNILLLGSDSRDPEHAGDGVTGERTDTIVIAHIPASHDKAYLVSLPRDLWVHVPRSADGSAGDTMAKINAAYAWGGTPLMVATVEEYTGVRIDHVAKVDFAGFVRVTDAVGGVDMVVDQTITSIHPPYRVFQAGPRHFNGEEALDYVRQRYQFADGDFSRIRHQQLFLKALLDKAASAGTLANVGSLRNFVTSVADSMTVDQDFSLVDLLWQFRSLRGDDLVFLTSPHSGTGNANGQSVVFSDRDKALSLYTAMNADTLGNWISEHGTD